MKGLLIKDIKLMANMKNSLLLILVIAVGMSAYLSDASFLIMYLGLIGTSFTASTISYDEYDNGFTFMFALPITREAYVVEKYGFGLIMSGIGWLLGMILAVVSGMLKGEMAPVDTVMEALLMLPVILILLSAMIPFHMKFGGEKGRIALIGVAGGMFIIFFMALKIVEAINLDLDAMWENLSVLSTGAVLMGAIAIGIVILVFSCRISISIMKRKEF
ncbi:MAG: ABC-2 transporter permease [Acetatifactor sp.]|nr:ABC-2 transporter permease [Acetatifactor sp.]